MALRSPNMMNVFTKKIFKGSRINKLLVTMHVDDCECAGKPQDLLAFKKALVNSLGR